MSLYFITYGCSNSTNHMVVSAISLEEATDFAYVSAQEDWYSYARDFDYDDDEEISDDEAMELEWEEMEQDIHYYAVIFDDEDEEHVATLEEQHGVPFEI